MYARRTLQRIKREARQPNGEPLDGALRKQMEARVGGSLEGVRVHTDSRANVLASELGSAAFTLRDHVFFGPGMYAPGTPRGDRVLSHELTHVAQGRQDAHAAARGPATVAPEHGPAEVEAGRVARGERIGALRAQHAHAIHRQPLPLVDDTATKPITLEKSKYLPWKTETLDQFGFNKDALTEDQTKRIPDVAKLINDTLATHPDSFVTVVGYTDQVGTDADNQDLGRRRANNVLMALVDAGVPKAVMSPGSLGKSFPVHDTGKADGANRRVEVNIFKRRFFEPGLLNPTPTPGGGGPPTPEGGGAPPDKKTWPGPILPQRPPGPAPGLPPNFWTLPSPQPASPDFITELSRWITGTLGREQIAGLAARIAGKLGMDKAQVKKQLDDAFTSAGEEGLRQALQALLEAIAGKKLTEPPPNQYGPQVDEPDTHILKLPPIPIPF